MSKEVIKALIYCRVSSLRQVVDGHGLDSQEQRCRAYAVSKGYVVVEVFQDDGISGGLFDRPAMVALINYLDKHPTENYVIIFDDLARFARDLKVHLQLKSELIARGARLESPNFSFEDSPEGELIENVTAATAQYERQKNRRQVIQKMKARMEDGYWCLPLPPFGFTYIKDPAHGKLISCPEPYKGILKKALEDFRDGIYMTIEEFRYAVINSYKQIGIKKKLSKSGAKRILTEILYTGWLEYEKWNVSLREAKHEGIISLDTFNIVQERLKGRAKVWKRLDYRPDFALRGHVLCDSCGNKLTASWNTGNGGKYANYSCTTKGCCQRYKVIPKAKIDPEFEALLSSVKLPNEVLDLANAVLNERWALKVDSHNKTENANLTEIEEIEQQIDNLMARISVTTDDQLISMYEEQIKKLTKKKRLLEQGIHKNYYNQQDFGTASDLVFTALKNPIKLWKSDDYNDKRSVILMYFENTLRYNREKGFGTSTLAHPIKLINDSFLQESSNVGSEGFEPPTSTV